MNIALVVNPRSGRGRAARVARTIQDALTRAGHEVHTQAISDHPLLDAGYELVVIVGGDGTVHHVAPHAAANSVPVYHVPMGTENLFARHLRMTREPGRLLAAIQSGRRVAIDLARVSTGEGRTLSPFFIMLSVGPDAGVVHRLAASRSGAIRHWSYVAPIVRECLSPSLGAITVDVDGERVVDARRGLLVVAVSPEYGVRLNPACRASVCDGVLDVVFFPAETGLGLLAWALRSRMRRHVRSPRLVYRTGTEVRVRCEGSPLPYQVDGEAGGMVDPGAGGLIVRVDPARLVVLTPPGS